MHAFDDHTEDDILGLVREHVAWKRPCAISQTTHRSARVAYFGDIADDDLREALREMGENVPPVNWVCVIHASKVPGDFHEQWVSPARALTIAHDEGWYYPKPPSGSHRAGFWNGVGEWQPFFNDDTVLNLRQKIQDARNCPAEG